MSHAAQKDGLAFVSYPFVRRLQQEHRKGAPSALQGQNEARHVEGVGVRVRIPLVRGVQKPDAGLFKGRGRDALRLFGDGVKRKARGGKHAARACLAQKKLRLHDAREGRQLGQGQADQHPPYACDGGCVILLVEIHPTHVGKGSVALDLSVHRATNGNGVFAFCHHTRAVCRIGVDVACGATRVARCVFCVVDHHNSFHLENFSIEASLRAGHSSDSSPVSFPPSAIGESTAVRKTRIGFCLYSKSGVT